MFEILNRDNGCVRVLTHCPPHAFFTTQEAKVVDALGMHLRLTTDEGVTRTKGAVPVPDGIPVGVTSVSKTDSYI